MTDKYGFQARVIEHSMAESHRVQLVTMQLRYPRFIHAEFMTHRVFSRNASSSRAIPVAKMLEQVRHESARPIHWGKNQPGMQANEQLTGQPLEDVQDAWTRAANLAANLAEEMNAAGAHKQVVNRILEPFQFISVIVTATEWKNFFALRDHEAAQPEIRHLAQLMKTALGGSKPRLVSYSHKKETADRWHLPYVLPEERKLYNEDPLYLCKLSTARCARVSYLNHDGTTPSIEKDLELHDRLVGSDPIHASPTEHQASPAYDPVFFKNFRGWIQYRYEVEDSIGET